MFITERQNYDSSTLFLLAARSTLAEMVQISGSKAKTDLIEYIHNDASDFEVMGLLMTGKLPPVKYSVLGEKLLFSNLKEQVMKNFGSLTQVIGENVLNSFLQEVDSVFPKLSTQKPVLEFFAAVNKQGGAGEWIKKQFAKPPVKHNPDDPSPTEAAAADHPVSKAITQAGDAVSSAAGHAKDWVGKQFEKPAGTGTVNKTYGDPKEAEAAPGIMHHIKSMIDDASRTGSDLASKIVTYVNSNQMAAGGVAAAALAALIAYAGYQVYKKFFSKAAKACAGQSGSAKAQCLAGFRKKAVVAQAQTLMKASAACAKSKDPQKCKAVVRAKVAKIREKLQ